ncbi:MFS transporter [Xenorhabdus sp. 12]|uniref:MFS transporter n=1 Tax=Xenorhabdus santafensis TaxID=2582833 RepID=A0ABU4S9N3_9GAMM|nr:MFS transporter [Xenorhabdus sp. 12]MDX7987518.1 MFS transporter [Xenorhabdus sp. 12]
MRSNTALLSLAVGAFAIGATEYSPMGMLPDIASDLSVSIPTAGTLVMTYALGVMLGAPFMTLLLIKRSPKTALIFLMSLFTVGNILSGVATDFTFLIIARFITSLNHGAFFGIGALVAMRVVEKGKEASAIASMFMGLTIANICGVPFITWLSQVVGWREAFLLISTLGILTMVALLRTLPNNMEGQPLNLKKELQVLSRPKVLVAMLCTIVGASAMFTLYTYIAPFMVAIAHISPAQISIMLVLVGIGFTFGNYLGGIMANRSILMTLFGLFTLLTISMILIPLIGTNSTSGGIMLVVWGIASFGIVPPLQLKVMQVASEAQALASSINIGAFNLGNAIGAGVGGSVLSLGFGYPAISYVGGIIALSGLILLIITAEKRVPVNEAYQKDI